MMVKRRGGDPKAAAYNAAVTEFNNAVEMFPTNIFAGIFGFKHKTLFQIPDREKANVKADFSRDNQ